MINSRKLTDLHPEAMAKAKAFKRKCLNHGIDVLIYCTFRDHEQQNALYAQGRTKPGRKVTNARGGKSFHNWKVAWDCVPMVGGKPAWSDRARYKQMGVIAESLGIQWSGRWKGRMRETAHFQYTKGYGLNYFQKGGTL